MPDPTNPNPQPGGATPAPGGADPNANPAARLTLAEVGDLFTAVVPLLTSVQAQLAKLSGGAGGGGVPGANPNANGDPANPRPNFDPKPAPGANGDPASKTPPPNPNPKPNPEDEHAMDAALRTQVEGLQKTVDTLAGTVKTACDSLAELTGKVAAQPAAPTIAALGAEFAARDKLADRLAAHVGTFDAKDKTLADVAKYGVEKLGLIDVPAGAEVATVSAYLAAADKVAAATVRVAASGMDAATSAPAHGDNFVTRHLSPVAAK